LLGGPGGPYSIAWPSAVKWPGGAAPSPPGVGETDVLVFVTRDGGTTIRGALAMDDSS